MREEVKHILTCLEYKTVVILKIQSDQYDRITDKLECCTSLVTFEELPV